MVTAVVNFVKNIFLFSSSLHFKENERSYGDGRDAYLPFGKNLPVRTSSPNLVR